MADAVDELFALPPSEFTAARNALVKQLRADKKRDEADKVKALRRPTVPAWALNQVARSDPDAIRGVVQAGAAVVAAQRRALSGVKDSGLREASQRRRDAIDEVWRRAAAVLRGADVEPQSHRQAVAATLEAASLDSEVAQVVTAGRLSSDVPAPSGFGDVSALSLVTAAQDEAADATASGDEPPDDEAQARAAQAQARAEADAAKRRAEQARSRAEDLADRAADARRRAVHTGDEATRLEQRAVKTRARADSEAAEADDLAAQAERAESEADDAEAEAGRLADLRS